MRVYRAVKSDPEFGMLYGWHTNKRAAEHDLRAHKKLHPEGPVGPEHVELVDVPTDKIGLVNWLARNFTSDNG
jgi:hypothetical protein